MSEYWLWVAWAIVTHVNGVLSDFWRWFAIPILFTYNKSLSFQVPDYLPSSIGKKGEEAIGIPSGIGTQAALVGYESSHQCATPFAPPRPAHPLFSNGPFPISPGPLYQNEVNCSAFDMELIFHFQANKTHFHNKGCAPGLILKVRVFGTRKWPIEGLSLPLDLFVFYFQNLWSSPSLILERRRHFWNMWKCLRISTKMTRPTFPPRKETLSIHPLTWQPGRGIC